MSARAAVASEDDVGTFVDCEAVVLVLDVRVGDGDTVGGADIEGVGVVAPIIPIPIGVVDGDGIKRKVLSAVDGETLDRGVLHVETSDGGLLH